MNSEENVLMDKEEDPPLSVEPSPTSFSEAFSFLPLIMELLRAVQDLQDPSSTHNERISSLALQLNERFRQSERLLKELEGAELTQEQQKILYQDCQLQLQKKWL
jgi:hypothetical protein